LPSVKVPKHGACPPCRNTPPSLTAFSHLNLVWLSHIYFFFMSIYRRRTTIVVSPLLIRVRTFCPEVMSLFSSFFMSRDQGKRANSSLYNACIGSRGVPTSQQSFLPTPFKRVIPSRRSVGFWLGGNSTKELLPRFVQRASLQQLPQGEFNLPGSPGRPHGISRRKKSLR